MMLMCPKCDGELDAMVGVPWGKPQRHMPKIVAFVCGWCASLMLADFEDREIFLLDEEMCEQLRSNAKLWQTIEKARADILKLPNRRPVLR